MFGLKQKYIDALGNCFAQYPGIEQVVVYGSRAKGNYRVGPEIDLTILGDLSFTDLLRLETQIDLSLKSHINSADLLAHIERVGQVFYSAVDSEVAMSGLS